MKEKISYREKAPQNSKELLRLLARRERIPADSSVAVVVAHQDDESIAFGAQIHRFPRCLMVHVTDGAPENPKEWKGLKTREAYAEVRKAEMNEALDIAGHTGLRESLGSADQEAAYALSEHARTLAELFKKEGINFVLTHSYEGGHPDHDAAAFAVHAAKKLLEKEGIVIHIIEAPLYRMNGVRSVRQRFVHVRGSTSTTLSLNEKERTLKRKLYAAHASQKAVLATMSTTEEKMREAPQYDFRKLPNRGRLSHIFSDADIGAETWAGLAARALAELGIGQAARGKNRGSVS